ncbi:50S ribosomal protein L15 [Desulfoplanes sp.]
MNLHELYPYPEQRADRKRVGRGSATGQGCTSGKGNKGQNARSGGGVPPWFEGGQMPLQRRLPKRGFKNPFRVRYQTVNLDKVVTFFPDSKEISIDDLYASGLSRKGAPIKILSDGDLAGPVSITAHAFSKKAVEKITKAGGQAIALEG